MNIAFHRWLLRTSDRAYQCLLALYPTGFRRAYKVQMAQVFRDCCRDALRKGGVSSVVLLWMVALADLATNALSEQVTTALSSIEQRDVLHAQLFGGQEQAVFLISAQQIPDATLLHLMDCPCATSRIGGPLAL